jgi:hypothetical protein
MDSRRKLDFSLVDDVCFGRLFKSTGVPIEGIPSLIVNNLSEIPSNKSLEETVHFRCRTGIVVRDDVPVMMSLLNQIKKLVKR